MTRLFISDLHLDESRPEITRLFVEFLEHHGGNVASLYILGDLFEAWIGDDDPSAHNQEIIAAMNRFAAKGSKGYFMHGNRDFLAGDLFSRNSGFTILQDPTKIDIDGVPTLLMHGDTLCVDDVEYQSFRRMVRDPDWQKAFLAKPLAARMEFAEKAREESRAQTKTKSAQITDVNQQAVKATMRQWQTPRLIHGHTHRPNIHQFEMDDATHERIVLGDWYEQGSVLTYMEGEYCLESLEL